MAQIQWVSVVDDKRGPQEFTVSVDDDGRVRFYKGLDIKIISLDVEVLDKEGEVK